MWVFEENDGSRAKASGGGARRKFSYIEYLAINCVTYKLTPVDALERKQIWRTMIHHESARVSQLYEGILLLQNAFSQIFIAFHLRKTCATAMSEDPVQNEVT